jgi:hypothetical protein
MINHALFLIDRILLSQINGLSAGHGHCAQFYPQKLFTSAAREAGSFTAVEPSWLDI